VGGRWEAEEGAQVEFGTVKVIQDEDKVVGGDEGRSEKDKSQFLLG